MAILSLAILGLAAALQAPATPQQAVVETSAGVFVIDLAADVAPNHVANFIKVAQAGTYDGTIFHRAVKYGVVQGGDPLSKDPSKRALWGTGGLNMVKAEPHGKVTKGSVGAVLIPGKPDSAGAQFFIAVVDQPGIDGQYTVFGHVSEGLEVVGKISETPVDDKGLVTDRVEIKRVSIRNTPAEAFATETVQELGTYRAVLDTSAGAITIEFFPDKAPNHVRQFLRLAQAGVYDGMAFNRVVPGFVIQTGALATRSVPLLQRQQRLVRNLQPEFNDTKHVKGIVSMARGDDPASASTSFFICAGEPGGLDGRYTAFGRVVDGMAAVEAIETAPRDGETPTTRIELKTVKVARR